MQTEKMQLRAVGDVLLVEQLRPKKSGLVHLPGTDIRKYNIGRVVSAGPDVRRAEEGNIVVWMVFKGQAVDHRDDERWFIKNEDVLGVVVKPEPWMVEELAVLDKAAAKK